ncbi:EF hand family protein [Trichomonas vaginalis G3]|uniref:EF hand family protein n=1 Tax=Trichomonas vaginalis (strain ATCC PRA-98 / G3) TaxID=412133 RepID=A2DAA5_TRIV3|nr:calcium ion binding [Trichomonas vaginalis G3]EAY22753.1 EF hand family protein [Trichomonas vaginalis G3]KAI5525564.1 calcium ion binding [Trichomonas vaginalis G3]|eukprot:XP_001583739.1 EF hand family protein [Trichomonas vaginalis G3]
MSKLTLDQRAEIKMAFRTFDPNKTEIISKKDFSNALRTMGFYLSDQEIDKYMQGKTNGMDYPTFKSITTNLILNRTQKQELKRMFLMFDTDHDGYISVHNLMEVCKKCGDKSSETLLKRMINDFDKSGRGKIDEHDFVAIFSE